MIQFYYLSVPLQKPEKWDPAVVNYQICIPENNAVNSLIILFFLKSSCQESLLD